MTAFIASPSISTLLILGALGAMAVLERLYGLDRILTRRG
jgi:hypothetical protein